jgi:8-oxo-dGTP pyrophosphatase MutT (NUDIX family)
MGHGNIEPGKAPVKPRDAATLIIWRNGNNGVEALMGRRSRKAAFVPDFYVFPGGRLDPLDHQVRPATPLNSTLVGSMGVRGSKKMAETLAITAVRETFEETGLLLAESGDVGIDSHPDWTYWKERGLAPELHNLGYFGRAITSPVSPIRFNARFFIVHADLLQGQLGGSGELSELAFYPAADVIDNMPIVDVTEFMLTSLIRFATNPTDFDQRTPLLSYRGLTPFIHYSSPRDIVEGGGRR